jgi:hypothetical protein
LLIIRLITNKLYYKTSNLYYFINNLIQKLYLATEIKWQWATAI